MRWNRFTIRTTAEAEEMVSYTLAELGIEGVEIQDRVPLTEEDKAQMFVDIMPDAPENDGSAVLNFYMDEEDDFSIDEDEDIDNDFNDEYEDLEDDFEEDDYKENRNTGLKHEYKRNSYKNEDDIDIDIWGNSITKENREEIEESDWGNEFIKINKKGTKKKKGFFDKFKK